MLSNILLLGKGLNLHTLPWIIKAINMKHLSESNKNKRKNESIKNISLKYEVFSSLIQYSVQLIINKYNVKIKLKFMLLARPLL